MLLIVGVIIIFVIICVQILDNLPEGRKLVISVPLLIILLILLITAVTIEIIADKEYVIEKEYEIVSLDRNQSTSGSFVLGSGSVDSEMHYFFYVEVSEKRYDLRNISSKNTFIVEEDRETALVRVYKEQMVNPTFRFLIGLSSERYTDIVVPMDSIEKTINP